MKDNPKPPAHLKGDVRKLWQRYADELHSRQMFLEADLSALERLCRLEVQADAMTAQLEREGLVIADRDGTQRRHPALMALQNVSTIVEALKRSLALGAFFRHRIGTPAQAEETKRPPSVLDLRPNGRYSRMSEEEKAEWHRTMDERRQAK